MAADADWSNGSLSIILLPAGEEGEGLLREARQWTASWLLSSAMWVRAEDVPIDTSGPPMIRARILGRDDEGLPAEAQVELFWKLGEKVRDRVRLIAIRTLQSTDDQQTTSRAVGRLANYLVKAMPAQEAIYAANPALRNLLRLNLVIDAAEETGLRGSDVFQPDWEANIVASPEDRTTPNSADAPPLHPRLARASGDAPEVFGMDRPERYYGWALAHVATVAGIWANIPKSVYDLSVDRPAVGHSMCLIQRVTVRGVLSDGLAIDLAMDVMSEVADGESDLELQRDAMLRHHVDVLSPEGVSARSTALTEFTLTHLDGKGFRYVAREIAPAERPHDVSLGSRIRLFLKLLLRGLLSLPRFLVQLLLRRLSAKLTVEGGDAVVVADMSWRGGLPSIDEGVFTIPELGDITIAAPNASPQVWRELRQMLLTALDAGESADEVESLLRNSGSGNPTVYPRRRDVVPDPRESWRVPAGDAAFLSQLVDLKWSDASTALSQLRQIEALPREASSKATQPSGVEIAAAAELERRNQSVEALELQLSQVELEIQRLTAARVAVTVSHPHVGQQPDGAPVAGGHDGR